MCLIRWSPGIAIYGRDIVCPGAERPAEPVLEMEHGDCTDFFHV